MVAPAAAITFFGGLISGSFISVVAHRVPRGESIVGPRSRCPSCGTTIAAYDNVPVFSWLLLRGRARCCGERISPRYPLVELALGILYVLIAIVLWGDAGEVALGLVFVTMLAAVTLTDLERRLIPNKILIAGAVAAVLIAAVSDPASLPERALAAAAAATARSGRLDGSLTAAIATAAIAPASRILLGISRSSRSVRVTAPSTVTRPRPSATSPALPQSTTTVTA
jgi:prepilin signal peptidase PulO-like enzyme (type II secretory pathway)